MLTVLHHCTSRSTSLPNTNIASSSLKVSSSNVIRSSGSAESPLLLVPFVWFGLFVTSVKIAHFWGRAAADSPEFVPQPWQEQSQLWFWLCLCSWVGVGDALGWALIPACLKQGSEQLSG